MFRRSTVSKYQDYTSLWAQSGDVVLIISSISSSISFEMLVACWSWSSLGSICKGFVSLLKHCCTRWNSIRLLLTSYILFDTYEFCNFYTLVEDEDSFCGLMVRVSGYRSRGTGFDSRHYQIFLEVGGLERGPLSLVRTIEDLLEWKSSGCGLENRD
jgi:hypothetical protein